ncbi:hypothetical protein PBRA_000329, partial [Plasmodiophora brassicae]
LPPDAVASLKQSIDAHLRANNIYETVRGIVGGFLSEKQLDFSGEDRVIKALHEKGVIDDIVTALGGGTAVSRPVQPHLPGRVLPNRRYLVVKVRPGRDFVEQVVNESSSGSMLTLYVQFGHQRFCSRPVIAQATPEFNEVFMLDLQSVGSRSRNPAMVPLAKVLHVRHRLHATLVKEDIRSKRREVLSSQHVEWRTVLETGTKSLCLELLSRRTNSDRSPIGLIDLELEIAPSPRPGATGAPLIDPSVIDKQIALEQSTTSANRRRFHSYAKSWWNDYLQIRPDHQQRVIKMFACNEDDERVFVCTFLRPIHCSRILPTALHAARFVRLIPFVPDVDVGGERTNVWNSLHVFLSRGYGDVEDHCALLCSLLLGFGLDAYVVCGKKHDGPHTWVMTRESKTRAMFWDSCTGRTYAVEARTMANDLAEKLPFVSIGCLFNHRNFYANVQEDNTARATQWDLTDPMQWKAMTADAIRVLPGCPPITLAMNPIDPVTAAVQLEHSLYDMIEDYRRDNLQAETSWDEHLSHCISPALAAYESQCVTGVSYGNALFQESIRHTIPLRFAFKAFPCQFDHRESGKILAHLLQSKVAVDILRTMSSFVHFALRVHIVPYAENVAATWVILGVKWRTS